MLSFKLQKTVTAWLGGVGCLTQCLWLVVLGGGSDVGLADGGGSRRRRVLLSGG